MTDNQKFDLEIQKKFNNSNKVTYMQTEKGLIFALVESEVERYAHKNAYGKKGYKALRCSYEDSPNLKEFFKTQLHKSPNKFELKKFVDYSAYVLDERKQRILKVAQLNYIPYLNKEIKEVYVDGICTRPAYRKLGIIRSMQNYMYQQLVMQKDIEYVTADIMKQVKVPRHWYEDAICNYETPYFYMLMGDGFVVENAKYLYDTTKFVVPVRAKLSKINYQAPRIISRDKLLNQDMAENEVKLFDTGDFIKE